MLLWSQESPSGSNCVIGLFVPIHAGAPPICEQPISHLCVIQPYSHCTRASAIHVNLSRRSQSINQLGTAAGAVWTEAAPLPMPAGVGHAQMDAAHAALAIVSQALGLMPSAIGFPPVPMLRPVRQTSGNGAAWNSPPPLQLHLPGSFPPPPFPPMQHLPLGAVAVSPMQHLPHGPGNTPGFASGPPLPTPLSTSSPTTQPSFLFLGPSIHPVGSGLPATEVGAVTAVGRSAAIVSGDGAGEGGGTGATDLMRASAGATAGVSTGAGVGGEAGAGGMWQVEGVPASWLGVGQEKRFGRSGKVWEETAWTKAREAQKEMGWGATGPSTTAHGRRRTLKASSPLA